MKGPWKLNLVLEKSLKIGFSFLYVPCQGSHSLEKSLYFIINPWKVLEFHYTVLKSSWIFPNIECEASQQSCVMKIRVFFRFNFVKKTQKIKLQRIVWKRQRWTWAKMWANTRMISGCVYELKCCFMPHGAGLTLRSWSIVLAFVLQQNAWKVQF